jgi:endonuclease/exonuclease/phosphatase (EEP) superfamily protein YafD
MRAGQGVLVTIGLLALLPALAATLLRMTGPAADGPALLASFSAYGIVGYLVAALCLVVAVVRARGARRMLVALTVVAVTGLGYHAATLAPLFVPDGRPASTRPFTVLTLNMRHGGADVVGLTQAVRGADVVVLVEASPAAVQQLDARGWRVAFPHVTGATENGDPGSVVYSRFPLRDSQPLPRSSFQQWATTVAVPEVGDVRLLAVHPCNPFCGGNAFADEHADLRAAIAGQPDLPLVVAGDFNAVPDHKVMRRLRSDGLEDASDLAGAGWLPTYPANTVVPPLLPIDHILVDSRLTATSVGTVRIGGTDHFALQAELAGTR